MAFSNSITRSFSITVLLLILLSYSSIHAMDCGGKPFHCENTTHFKICVDFGNGVSSTVDDFVIPCPPGTECRGKNHFECEFLPATTPAAIALLSDVTNDTKVLDTSATTPLMWEAVTTNLPPGSPHDTEFSERYLNTEKPLTGGHLQKLSTDSGQLANDTEVIVTTNFPETVTGTTVDVVTSISENITDEIINMTSMAPESLYTLVVSEQYIVATESPVTVIPLTGEAVSETVQENQVTDVSETSTAMPEEFMIIKSTTSVSTTDETAFVTEGSVIIQNEENNNDIYQAERNKSTPTLEKLTTSAVDNGEEGVINVTASNNPSIEGSFIVATTVTSQVNSFTMDNTPEELGTNELGATEIPETKSNQEISEMSTYESLIDATTVAQPHFGTSFGADIGLKITTSASNKAEPLQNVHVTESISVTSTLNPVILNASKIDNFTESIPSEPSILNVLETKVAESVRNQEITEKVVNIEGVFETTTPVQEITNAPSDFENRRQADTQHNGHDWNTNDLVGNFKPEGEIIETSLSETARDAVPVENYLSGVFDNLMITTENTEIINNNLIEKGNVINLDTTTQTEIPITDMTTEFQDIVTHRAAVSAKNHLGSAFDSKFITTEAMTTKIKNPIKNGNEINVDITTEKQIPVTDQTNEFLDIVTQKDAVPVEAHIAGAFDNILITTESTEKMNKNPIENGNVDITTEKQIPVTDVTTEFLDIVTQKDAVPVKAHIAVALDNILITTERTEIMNTNLIKKGNVINLDTTTETEIPITDVTTEFQDVVTHKVAVSAKAHLGSVFDNKFITTERMTTKIKNPIKKGYETNVDYTTEKQIPVTDQNTESLDIVTQKDAVPVEAHIVGAFDNIWITTESTTAMIKNTIKKGIGLNLDITTETQISISDMATDFHDNVTHTKSILKDTAAEDSIFTPNSYSFTNVSDSTATEATMNTVSNIELTTLAEPNYEIVPLIKTLSKHKSQETTVFAPDYSQTIFEGTGYQSEGINENEGWLIFKDVETTTDNIIIKETKESFMTKNSVVSKSERSTESSLLDENNKVTPDLFENLEVTLKDIVNEVNDNKMIPENKRFTIKAIQEKEGAAVTEKLDNTLWDPSDSLLMNMPNVVFELDKNTDSIPSDFVTDADTVTEIDETSYVGQQYKKTTGYNDAFPILSETIPYTVINQVPSRENVIETSQHFFESANSASNLLDNGMIKSTTKAPSQIVNTEKNTITIDYQPITESVTVPVKGTNEDYELNNNGNLVTNQHINALVSKTDENEESPPAETSGVLPNAESSFVSHSNGVQYVSLDPFLDSSSFPETEVQTESQNLNGVLSTYFQTMASDASPVPIKQLNFNAQTKRTTVATTTVTNNIKYLKPVSTQNLENTVTSRTSSSQTYNTQETVKWGLTDHSTNIGVNKEELTNKNGQEQIRTMPMTIESTTPISSTRTSGILNMASQRDIIENGGSNIYTDASDSGHTIIKNITNTYRTTNDLLVKITNSLPFNLEETSVNDTTTHVTSNNTSTLENSSNEKKQLVGEINEYMGMGQALSRVPQEISPATGLPSKTYLIETVIDTKKTNVDKILISGVTTVTAEGLKFPTQIIKDTPVEKEEEYTKSPPNVSKEITIPFLARTTILPHVQTTKIYQSFTPSMTDMENTKSTTHGSNMNTDSNAYGELSKLFLVSTLIPPSFESSYANTQATVKYPMSASSTGTTIMDKSVTTASTITTITKADENININAPVTTAAVSGYDCSTVVRGRFSDKFDCRKFYICIDKHAIVGYCPGNAVFSPIKKQCTKNLAHCLRDGEFQCTSQGRFVDIQRKNIYYVCVRNALAFVRFQFQCQDGFILNKSTVRCEKFVEKHVTTSWLDVTDKQSLQSRDVSKKALEKKVAKQKTNKSDVSNKNSEQSSRDVSKKEKNPKSNESPEPKEEVEEKRKSIKCTSVGKIPHPEDCRKYYVCYKNKKSELRRKRKKCDSDEVFDKSKSKCVDIESYECNLG